MVSDRQNKLKMLVEEYMRTLSTPDYDACLKLFTDSCVVRDPYGEKEVTGKEGLKAHLEEIGRVWYYYTMRVDNFFPGGNDRMAVRWSVSATARNGKLAEFSGISIFNFSGDLISSLETYWYIRSVMNEIS